MSDEGEKCLAFNGIEACAAACVQVTLWSYVYPTLTVFGVLLNVAAVVLFRRGTLAISLPKFCRRRSRQRESTNSQVSAASVEGAISVMGTVEAPRQRRSSGVIRFRFSGPGYTFIETMAVNSLFFFLTGIPLFVVRCRGPSCGWQGGWPGYLLASSVYLLSYFLNEVLHWTNIVLVMCYGIQRCCAASGKIKLQRKFNIRTTRYCVGLAFQIASYKELVQLQTRALVQVADSDSVNKTSLVWMIGPASSVETDTFFRGDFAQFFFEPILSISFLVALLFSFSYICVIASGPVWSLPSPPPSPGHEAAQNNGDHHHQQMLSQQRQKPCAERERRMTIVYLAICSAYMITVVFDLVNSLFLRDKGGLADEKYCDARIAITETVNFSLMISEMSATLMNILGNRIFRAGFGSFIIRRSSHLNEPTSTGGRQSALFGN